MDGTYWRFQRSLITHYHLVIMKTPHIPFFTILICNLLLITSIVKGQSVTIGAISGTQFCAGDPISVTFTATGTWGAGNVFLLQLSDPTGSFSNGFQYIGSVAGTLSGTFTIDTTIRASATSKHYRFRILTANPSITSADNGSDIAIATAPDNFVFYADAQAGSVGTPITFSGHDDIPFQNSGSQDNAFWDFGAGANPAKATSTAVEAKNREFSQDVTYSTSGDKTVTLTIVKPRRMFRSNDSLRNPYL
jgi:hypothetical protein